MRTFKSISLIIACLLFLAIIFPFERGNAKPASTESESVQSTISVTGSADVLVVPDEVVITLGIDTRNKDIVKAKTENDNRVRKILDIAKQFKIDPKNIQTDFIDIRPGDVTQKPIYDSYYGNIAPSNLGYVVRKKIVITVKDLSKFEEFLTEVVKNGTEYVQGVEFKTSELRKHKDKARELAVKSAREKADAMTSVLGQKAGKAVTIREEQEYYWSWYDSWYSGWYGTGTNPWVMANNVQNIVPSGGQPPADGIAPGQIKVSAKVSIDFSLE